MREDLPITTTLEVKDTCLCFRAQRAARALARRFDHAFAALGLTHGQFSLLMALNQPAPPPLSRLADFLGMDRTSLTAKLKAVVRNGWVVVEPDPADRRNRKLSLTDAGVDLLKEAFPIWRGEHADLNELVSEEDQIDLKDMLDALSG
ncbi:MAG: MarR family transcriptional regulator [Ponticaulis sp.]|nr:MarR family transcriptional regulator [Ponticaulis sp.]